MAILPEQEAARTSREAPISFAPGHPRVDTGWNLITTLEKQICGSKFVGSVAIAEGYSAAGIPSASLSPKPPSLVALHLIHCPLVHHIKFDSESFLNRICWK